MFSFVLFTAKPSLSVFSNHQHIPACQVVIHISTPTHLLSHLNHVVLEIVSRPCQTPLWWRYSTISI